MDTQTLALRHSPPRSNGTQAPFPFDRFGLGCGMAAAAIYLAGAVMFISFVVPEMPPLSAPAEVRAAFYAEMSRSMVYRSVSFLGELQMLFLLPFCGALLGVLRRAEGGSGALSFAAFGAGLALAVIAPITILIEDHLMLGFAAAGVDPVIVSSIDGLGPLSFALGGFPQAVMASAAAVLLTGRGLAPRWIGWFGGVVAVLSLAGTGTLVGHRLFPLAALAMLLFRIWLLALCVALLRRPGGVS